jgi:hypothetical protein
MSTDIEISIKKDNTGVYYVGENNKILGNIIEYVNMFNFNNDNRIFSMTQWTYKRLPFDKRKNILFRVMFRNRKE